MLRKIIVVVGWLTLIAHGCIYQAAHAGETYSLTCSRGFNCDLTMGYVDAEPRVIYRSPNEDSERDRKWMAFCNPQFRRDAHGVERAVYAHEGCEYGRTE
jgi:hypothetical protein